MPPSWPRWPTKRRKAAASWCWRRRKYGLRGRNVHELHATFIPFSAQTRISGVNLDGRQIRKGAADAIENYVRQHRGEFPGKWARKSSRSPSRAARRWSWPKAVQSGDAFPAKIMATGKADAIKMANETEQIPAPLPLALIRTNQRKHSSDTSSFGDNWIPRGTDFITLAKILTLVRRQTGYDEADEGIPVMAG